MMMEMLGWHCSNDTQPTSVFITGCHSWQTQLSMAGFKLMGPQAMQLHMLSLVQACPTFLIIGPSGQFLKKSWAWLSKYPPLVQYTLQSTQTAAAQSEQRRAMFGCNVVRTSWATTWEKTRTNIVKIDRNSEWYPEQLSARSSAQNSVHLVAEIVVNSCAYVFVGLLTLAHCSCPLNFNNISKAFRIPDRGPNVDTPAVEKCDPEQIHIIISSTNPVKPVYTD